jgi:hypothetical protein
MLFVEWNHVMPGLQRIYSDQEKAFTPDSRVRWVLRGGEWMDPFFEMPGTSLEMARVMSSEEPSSICPDSATASRGKKHLQTFQTPGIVVYDRLKCWGCS